MFPVDPADEVFLDSYLLVDFDGTIVDSVAILYEIYQNFLQKYGKKGTKEEFESLKGPTIPEVVKILKTKHKLDGSEDSLLKEYNALLKHDYAKNVNLLPHIHEAL